MEIRATIKRFIRFYSFLIQATCYENVDLHKKYNFLTYLVKEIETGGGGNDFDIADKITASNFRQTKTGDKTSPIESKPEVRLPTPNEVYFDEATKKKLSEIIDEINAAYNKSFDVDVATKSALQMRDLLLKTDICVTVPETTRSRISVLHTSTRCRMPFWMGMNRTRSSLLCFLIMMSANGN